MKRNLFRCICIEASAYQLDFKCSSRTVKLLHDCLPLQLEHDHHPLFQNITQRCDWYLFSVITCYIVRKEKKSRAASYYVFI
jgi:hypothetical protein